VLLLNMSNQNRGLELRTRHYADLKMNVNSFLFCAKIGRAPIKMVHLGGAIVYKCAANPVSYPSVILCAAINLI
jgi:hypothetical protein